MNRKDFLKGLGLASLGFALPGSKLLGKPTPLLPQTESCVLIPTETAGPFPLDLTTNSFFFRQDVREGKAGVQLNLRMKIIGLANCEPMPNVRVNIWHCDKDGIYSGYNVAGNPGDVNGTDMRGYQITDANGEVEFITILPGWYTGRICHIHFQVYVSTSYAAVSQLTFPLQEKNDIYSANASIYTKGPDPLSFSQDGVFVDGHTQQLATLTPNSITGGYDSYLEVTVEGTGTVGIGHIERETAKVFNLGQNFPNPFQNRTRIPIHLKQPAHIQLELWDLSGRKLATLWEERKGVGEFEVEVSAEKFGLTNGNYVYQLVAETQNGIFRMPKIMTVKR